MRIGGGVSRGPSQIQVDGGRRVAAGSPEGGSRNLIIRACASDFCPTSSPECPFGADLQPPLARLDRIEPNFRKQGCLDHISHISHHFLRARACLREVWGWVVSGRCAQGLWPARHSVNTTRISHPKTGAQGPGFRRYSVSLARNLRRGWLSRSRVDPADRDHRNIV